MNAKEQATQAVASVRWAIDARPYMKLEERVEKAILDTEREAMERCAKIADQSAVRRGQVGVGASAANGIASDIRALIEKEE